MRKYIETADKDDEIYFKISPADFIEVNRALLEVKASAVNMQLKAEKLKKRMKAEIRARETVKRQSRAVLSSFNSLTSSLPKMKEIQLKKEVPVRQVSAHSHERAKEEHKEDDLEKQLNDIKRKISTL